MSVDSLQTKSVVLDTFTNSFVAELTFSQIFRMVII